MQEFLQLNNVQEIFLVLYSILFGSMLSSLGGLMPFPWNRIVSNKKYPYKFIPNKGKLDFEYKTEKEIGFSRLSLSIFILNICPLLLFFWVLYTLRIYPSPFWEELPSLIYVALSSFSVFGFYRLYHVLMIWNPTKWIFYDRQEAIKNREIYTEDIIGHLCGTIFYLLPPLVLSFFTEFINKSGLGWIETIVIILGLNPMICLIILHSREIFRNAEMWFRAFKLKF